MVCNCALIYGIISISFLLASCVFLGIGEAAGFIHTAQSLDTADLLVRTFITSVLFQWTAAVEYQMQQIIRAIKMGR